MANAAGQEQQSVDLPHVAKAGGHQSQEELLSNIKIDATSRKAGASEGEVVVLYFEPSATQNLKSSGFPEGGTTRQNRPYPSNSPMAVSRNLSFFYNIGYNCGPLSNLCHVVYATKGFTFDPCGNGSFHTILL